MTRQPGPAGNGMDASTKVVLIDDEVRFSKTLRTILAAHGYDVAWASTGAVGLDMVARHDPELVILDIGLPQLDGFGVLRTLRGWSDIPVIVLSARHNETAKVDALDLGADDYVTKPFAMAELLARMRANLRRKTQREGPAIVKMGDVSVDLAAKSVSGPEGAIRLTPTEWRLLEALARNCGRLVPQKELLAMVWGPEHQNEGEYLRVYMGRLRKKLESDPAQPLHLLTEPGLGCRLQAIEA